MSVLSTLASQHSTILAGNVFLSLCYPAGKLGFLSWVMERDGRYYIGHIICHSFQSLCPINRVFIEISIVFKF